MRSTKNTRWTNCKLELSFLSQFFHNRRHFSSHRKDLSTTHSLGKTTNACSSAGHAVASLFDAGRANLIFLMPVLTR